MAQQNKNKKSGSHGGQIVRYTKGKRKFEVVAHKGTVLKYRDGKLGFGRVLMIDQVFTNQTRGDIANSNDLLSVFGTEDIQKCCEEIVKTGDLQYSPQERKQFLEAKTNEIIYYINKNYIDPKNKLPHPADRISHTLKECKIRIDPDGDTRRQAEDAVNKMRGKLMFAKAVSMQALLTIKHANVGQCTNLIHKLANVTHEEWTGTGCVYSIELSKADLQSLQKALMKPTNGDYNMQFLDDSMTAKSAMDDSGDGGKKKKKKKKDKKHKHKHKKEESKQNDDNTEATDGKHKKKKKKKKKHKSGTDSQAQQ